MPEALSLIGRAAIVFGLCVLVISYIQRRGYRRGFDDGYNHAATMPLGTVADIAPDYLGIRDGKVETYG